MEPIILYKGKIFEKIVKKNFYDYTKDGKVKEEANIRIDKLNNLEKIGRIDILIDELGDFVTILEIKNTDWDKISNNNIKRNLYRHQRQLFKYIDSFMNQNNLNVCHGIIYPKPPLSNEKKDYIEYYMLEHYCVPVYWYVDIESK